MGGCVSLVDAARIIKNQCIKFLPMRIYMLDMIPVAYSLVGSALSSFLREGICPQIKKPIRITKTALPP